MEEIGVKELDESHRVEAILKERYSNDCAGSIDKDRYLKDLRRFIRLIQEHPDQSKLFKQYCIFWSEDKKWRTPVQCYLDLCAYDTGLRAFFEAVVDKPPKKSALAQFYETCGLKIETLREFAEAVGVQTNLTIIKQKIPWSHPECQILKSFPDSRRTYTGTDDDYDIEELAILLEQPTKEKAKLIWRTLCSLSDECLYARYRPNQQYSEKVGAASFVHSLRKAVWVPQDNAKGLLFTTPSDARVEFLPPGFHYERGQIWLEAIEFGNRPSSTTEDSPQMARTAEFLGTDQEGLVRVQEFLQLSPETQQEALDEMLRKEHNKKLPKFPDQDSTNPKRRTSRIAAEYQNAPAKEYETRYRSVRTSKVDNDKATYLRLKYTNEDDQMICQICVKEMPFKKRNGDYYFEAVEALSGDYISKEHVAQCIALCPTCAARYQEFVKKDDSAMQSLFDGMKGSIEPVISIKLGEWDTSIRFVKTHWLEMKAILKSVE